MHTAFAFTIGLRKITSRYPTPSAAIRMHFPPVLCNGASKTSTHTHTHTHTHQKLQSYVGDSFKD